MNNITDINDINVGDHLLHQREPDAKYGFFDWGIVERRDLAKIKRDFANGTYLFRFKR